LKKKAANLKKLQNYLLLVVVLKMEIKVEKSDSMFEEENKNVTVGGCGCTSGDG